MTGLCTSCPLETINQKENKMKEAFFTIAISLVLVCSAQQNTIHVPANQTILLDYPSYALWNAALQNSSIGVRVVILSKANQDTIRSFGLGKKGKADVLVERDAYLCLINSSSKPATVRMEVTEQNPIMPQEEENNYRSFTLRNNSAKSIPLIIPNVMNPNLSPFSNSGVSLKIGQEVYFKYKGKKRILLVVDESIKQGEVVEVSTLLKQRMKEVDGN